MLDEDEKSALFQKYPKLAHSLVVEMPGGERWSVPVLTIAYEIADYRRGDGNLLLALALHIAPDIQDNDDEHVRALAASLHWSQVKDEATLLPTVMSEETLREAWSCAAEAGKVDHGKCVIAAFSDTVTRRGKTPLEALTWSGDPAITDIADIIDNGELSLPDAARLIVALAASLKQNLGECLATKLTVKEACAAHVLADKVITWAIYADAYHDYKNPPWHSQEAKVVVA